MSVGKTDTLVEDTITDVVFEMMEETVLEMLLSVDNVPNGMDDEPVPDCRIGSIDRVVAMVEEAEDVSVNGKMTVELST